MSIMQNPITLAQDRNKRRRQMSDGSKTMVHTRNIENGKRSIITLPCPKKTKKFKRGKKIKKKSNQPGVRT